MEKIKINSVILKNIIISTDTSIEYISEEVLHKDKDYLKNIINAGEINKDDLERLCKAFGISADIICESTKVSKPKTIKTSSKSNIIKINSEQLKDNTKKYKINLTQYSLNMGKSKNYIATSIRTGKMNKTIYESLLKTIEEYKNSEEESIESYINRVNKLIKKTNKSKVELSKLAGKCTNYITSTLYSKHKLSDDVYKIIEDLANSSSKTPIKKSKKCVNKKSKDNTSKNKNDSLNESIINNTTEIIINHKTYVLIEKEKLDKLISCIKTIKNINI